MLALETLLREVQEADLRLDPVRVGGVVTEIGPSAFRVAGLSRLLKLGDVVCLDGDARGAPGRSGQDRRRRRHDQILRSARRCGRRRARLPLAADAVEAASLLEGPRARRARPAGRRPRPAVRRAALGSDRRRAARRAAARARAPPRQKRRSRHRLSSRRSAPGSASAFSPAPASASRPCWPCWRVRRASTASSSLWLASAGARCANFSTTPWARTASWRSPWWRRRTKAR